MKESELLEALSMEQFEDEFLDVLRNNPKSLALSLEEVRCFGILGDLCLNDKEFSLIRQHIRSKEDEYCYNAELAYKFGICKCLELLSRDGHIRMDFDVDLSKS